MRDEVGKSSIKLIVAVVVIAVIVIFGINYAKNIIKSAANRYLND